MKERNNLIGAVVAHIVYISSIVTFLTRIFVGVGPGYWIGMPLLLMVFPLVYLLWAAPRFNRPPLYYIQCGLMLVFIILLFLVDYVLEINFRQTQWMVISFVVVYFAAMGGMIGVASQAGRRWTISAVIFFFMAGILAFIQRAITGL